MPETPAASQNPKSRIYSLQASVVRVQMSLIKIDKGRRKGVRKGDYFDLFASGPEGTAGGAVARAEVKSVNADGAVLSVVQQLQDTEVEEGFIARKLIHKPPAK